MGEFLLCQISTSMLASNVFKVNFSQLVVRMLFVVSVCMEGPLQSHLKKAVL